MASAYDPRLPSYVQPIDSLSRPSASDLNRNQVSSGERQQTITGLDQVMPVIYGEDRVGGLFLARPVVPASGSYASKLVCAIGWSWGEIEGVQALYINGADLPANVSVTHYTGTANQDVDPILKASIAGFNDAFPNWAYSVFVINQGAITGFPRFEAVVRGRKVFDPRSGVVQWTRNPALCLRDFVTSTLYGPGRDVIGVVEVANRCDSMVGGVEVRCQMGLTLARSADLSGQIDLLAAYAECLWSYDGDRLLLVPDAPVEKPAAVLGRADIIENSMRLTGADLSDAPTAVTVRYTPNSGNATAWGDQPARVALPGVDTGEVPELTSDVNMPGLRRLSEATRKALMRLRRLQLPGRYAWQSFDEGLRFQRGDVVRLPDGWGLTNRWVRILSVEMIALGIHQVTAEHYDALLYPDDIPTGSVTTVPVGAVVPFYGGAVPLPSGWSSWAGTDGRALLGAGGSYPNGTVGGDKMVTIRSVTSAVPAHVGTGKFSAPTGPVVVQQGGTYVNLAYAGGAHTHGYSATGGVDPLYWTLRWIQKTGSPDVLPTNAGVFCNATLVSGAMTAVTLLVGRLAKAGSNVGPGGSAMPITFYLNMDISGEHTHASRRQLNEGFWKVNASIPAGGHSHSGSSVALTVNPRRRRLALYVATGETEIIPGAIIGWPFETLPNAVGWHWCDGANGTVDLRDYFIEYGAPTTAGSVAGDNTATWTGVTVPDGKHNHRGGVITAEQSTESALHSDDEPNHQHSMGGSTPHLIPFYALRFIQYTGN